MKVTNKEAKVIMHIVVKTMHTGEVNVELRDHTGMLEGYFFHKEGEPIRSNSRYSHWPLEKRIHQHHFSLTPQHHVSGAPSLGGSTPHFTSGLEHGPARLQ
jgi:hypothetical protein